ncbi:MAG: hypothetical protein LBL81_05395 [Tannerella sp.]|jgi:hypothetical protein|nr:hypothetical protein [Tannerella sp.]
MATYQIQINERTHQGKQLLASLKAATGIVTFLVPKVNETDDSLMTEDAFFSKIDRSLQEAKEGKVIRKKEGQSIGDFLAELCTE